MGTISPNIIGSSTFLLPVLLLLYQRERFQKCIDTDACMTSSWEHRSAPPVVVMGGLDATDTIPSTKTETIISCTSSEHTFVAAIE